MRKIDFGYNTPESEAEVVDMEKLVESESIYEQMEDEEEYTDLNIICFTFEDGMVARKDGKLASPKQFEAVFSNNERIFTTSNLNGYNVFIATSRDDLHKLGYIIMNTAEFIQENPDGLYDIWVELLAELKS